MKGSKEKETLLYFAQIVLAVECMHNRDMIHRDIKPANIFVQQNKNGIHILKLGDFGCAR